MSKRKDHERALKGQVYRNGQLITKFDSDFAKEADEYIKKLMAGIRPVPGRKK